jgi:cytochrome c-type biogenesis protein
LFEQDISYFVAFSAGVLSFFSPCVLPLIPAYLSYITGLTIEQYSQRLGAEARRKVILNTVFFILGFSFVFIVVFGAGTSLVGSLFKQHKDTIGRVGGVIIVLFGLHFMGLFKIKWLYREKRAHFKKIPAGCIGSFLIGVAFSAGWTPCVGPILAAIIGMGLAAESQWQAIRLLSLYAFGMAIPFFLTSLAINFFLPLFNRVKHHMRAVEVVTGVLLIFVGGLMFTGRFSALSGMFMEYWPFGS